MAARQGRSRGRLLLLAALVAVWIAVVVVVWRPAPVRDHPGQPAPAAARQPASAALPATSGPAR